MLVAKSVPFELQVAVSDLQGRYVFLLAKVAGDLLLILAW